VKQPLEVQNPVMKQTSDSTQSPSSPARALLIPGKLS
jgi:hypothetical protein